MSFDEKILINATTIDQLGTQKSDQALVIAKGHIVWCGAMSCMPIIYKKTTVDIEDCQGYLITPGLIDCHTHLVYAGQRSSEFKQRLEGASYTEIAQSGGGILSTVRDTRAASEEELLKQSLPRILAMRAGGVTTVEIKSGYGLDLNNELKMLKVAKALGQMSGVRVQTTFLGAHAVPLEYQGKHQDYVDFICDDLLPRIVEERLADAIDVFCEHIAFSIEQTEQLFTKASALGLPIKCHADQLSNIGASALAARFNALSCDHLEYLDEHGATALAAAGSVGVLLPGAFYFLRETRKPPVELMRHKGIGMAIATDCNPGSSPTTSLLLMMNMACQFFSMTIPEVLSAVTFQAAKALGLAEQVGSINIGMAADLVRWSVKDSAELCYHFGTPMPHATMVAGEWKSSWEGCNE